MKGLTQDMPMCRSNKGNDRQRSCPYGMGSEARDKGGIIFVDLRDRSGIMQLIFENGSIDEEGFAKAGKLRSEFVIAVTGVVEERGGAVNKNLATGEIELRVNPFVFCLKQRYLRSQLKRTARQKMKSV
mgnify:CR=1 FL=1